MNRPLRVGIIGYGFATATFHAPLVRSVPGLVLAAISSSDPAKVHAALPEVETETSHQALISRPDLDLIVIPTPNDTHYPLAKAALDAGKHVVVDKPFTVSVDEAEELIAHSQRVGKLLSVFHSRRWDSDFLTLQGLVGEGRLGRITHFESHIDRFRPQVRDRWREGSGPGAGLWYDLGPHLLDQALVLFGEPDGLTLHQALARDGALSDDWFHAVLDYGTLRVLLHATVVSARPGLRYAVHGLSGSFLKEGMDPQEEALKAGGVPGSDGWGVDPRPGVYVDAEQREVMVPGLPGAYQVYYQTMRDAILGRGPVPVSASDALRVMRWIEAGRRSAATGQRMDKTLL